MALKTTVKVTINNLSDARYCAGMGVDLIGFSVDPDDSFYLSPDNFSEIAEWLSGVDFVAELNDKVSFPDDYVVDIIQVNDPTTASLFPDKKIIVSGDPKKMRSWKDIFQDIPNLTYLLIQIDSHKAEIEDIMEEFSEFPLLIGFDLSTDDVETVSRSKSKGIALKGSDELKPGLKDYDALADILETLEVDEPY